MTSFDEDDILKLLTDNSQIEWQIKKFIAILIFVAQELKVSFLLGLY